MQKSNMKILFVEDDETNANLLADVLKKKFDNVTVAFDGVEGLEKFKLDDFDIVLSDIEMPRMNGIEMVKEIKKINPSIYTIFLTAYTEASYFIEAIHVKVDRFLTKPLDVRLLFSYIDEYEAQLNSKKLIIEQEKLLKHYKQVIDDILIVVKTDADGVIQYANQKFYDISGYNQEEVIGKTHPDIVSHDTLMDKELFKIMWEDVKNLKPHQMIVRNQDKYESSFWLESYFYPISDTHGNLTEIICFSKDITKQIKKEKEKESQNIQESHQNIAKAIEVTQHQFVKYIPLPSILVNNESLVVEYNDDFETLVLMSVNTELYEKLLDRKLKLSDIISTDDDMLLIETLNEQVSLEGISQTFKVKSKHISHNQTLVSFIDV
ncbi:response regulator [Arcobacter sp. FWKO B]|uniref:response regulator n=1 Tax=Arcobacter sp. FWKO B TaxID=2593672 RepID=UPI0018A4542E|nr:response regulator [Arcobacter sp. FWKO B]QOG11581.1 response regulator [Arcobacter sp. FWKO B]